MTPSIQLPPQQFRAAPVPETFDAEARTVRVMATSGVEVSRYDYELGRYLESLDVTDESVSLERLNAGASVLRQHDTWDLSSVIGVVERAWIEDGSILADIRFSEREEVAGIVRDIESGVLRHFSIGYEVLTYRDDTQPGEDVRRFTAIDWEPYELSVVSVPAEFGAGTRQADRPATREVAIIQRNDMDNFGEGVATGAEEQATSGGADGAETRNGQTATAPAPQQRQAATPPVDEAAVRRQGAEQERERTREISEHARALGLGAEATERLIDTGRSLSALAADVAREYTAGRADQSNEQEFTRHLEVGEEELTKHRSAASAALFARMRPGSAAAQTGLEQAGEYRSRTLLDTVRLLETVHGRDGLRAGTDALVQRAFHTTGDLPILLEEAGRRTLRDTYEMAAATWRTWAREGDLMDFRPHDRVRVGDAPELEEVPDGGDIKFGTVGESKETIKLASYARGVGLGRRALINDDLGAFARLIESQSQRVADLVSNIAYAELTGGQVGGSGLFVSAKNNSAAEALTVAGLGALEKLMLDQKSTDGIPLALMPKFLIVPTALKVTADQLTAEINPTQASEVNPYRGVLTPVVEPRLTAAGTFYLAADPNRIDTIEIAWLEGHRGPQFMMEECFANRGIKFAVWADVSAKAIDYRGLVRGTGA